ncbi:hypothetical protein NC796_06900 [Aliifodinibius sp. S!AR15-10]|uniref:hypothetical protein n=1 Tax=Aliifodinibius sp. S!AR15-10 TaxID=2950437 RepID=UPI00285D5FBF|nr:hypothetical protein [Aliifodinibius sp. S!AR15-10]MDR8390857.1 hypothetical protein [Aliifodinibius sp. S!AR15-10]
MIRVFHNNRQLLGLGLFVLLFLGIPLKQGNCQFLDLQLQVDSELRATTEQPLNFGTLSTNSGLVEIRLGAVNMGIFSIRALENQNLLIALNTPAELSHDNPAIKESIPLNLETRYGYSPQNYQASSMLPESGNSITVAPTDGQGPWSTFYIFVYGSIEIGDIPEGTYSDEIFLSVEYF